MNKNVQDFFNAIFDIAWVCVSQTKATSQVDDSLFSHSQSAILWIGGHQTRKTFASHLYICAFAISFTLVSSFIASCISLCLYFDDFKTKFKYFQWYFLLIFLEFKCSTNFFACIQCTFIFNGKFLLIFSPL